MDNVTQFDFNGLLNRLPAAKLPLAYSMLEALVTDEVALLPNQADFLRLPLADRRRVLREQAQQMVSYYEQTASEREAWQSGEFSDD